jgi:hypothetical protein
VKISVPATEVEVCDVCHREGYLQTCIFCGGRYCLLCRGRIPGCIHTVDVCSTCAKDKAVLGIAAKHAPLINAAIMARDAEIVRASLQRQGGDVNV